MPEALPRPPPCRGRAHLALPAFAALALLAATRALGTAPPPDPGLQEPAAPSQGDAFCPVLSYAPDAGAIVGGAAFTYPLGERGLDAHVQAAAAPAQPAAALLVGGEYRRAWGALGPVASLAYSTFDAQYHGLGNASTVGYATVQRRTVDASAGVRARLGDGLQVDALLLGKYASFPDAALLDPAEGPVAGAYLGAQARIARDTRDDSLAPTHGSVLALWGEQWLLQAGRGSSRTRAGLDAILVVPLRAPGLVLALRGQAAASAGDRAYLTTMALGGDSRLRGYTGDRWRGDALLLGTVELRYPLLGPLSGAAFAEAGRVFADGAADAGPLLHPTAGAGLRYGLPPDRKVKVRLDYAQTGEGGNVYLTFCEAF